MSRMILSVGALTVLLSSMGCRMCCHPYDYSGPVYQSPQSSGCQSCVSQRAGSILSNGPEVQVPSELARQPREKTVSSAPIRSSTRSQVPAQAQRQVSRNMQRQSRNSMQGQLRGQSASFTAVNGKVEGRVEGKVQVGEVPGSEQILSVTDRVVDSGTTVSSSSQVASGSTEEESSVASSGGWTARRPVPEVLR